MVTIVTDIDKILAETLLSGTHPELEELGISPEVLTALLRPILSRLHAQAVEIAKHVVKNEALIKEKNNILRLKDKEIEKLKRQIERFKQGGSIEPPQATSENSSLPPSKDPIGMKRTSSLRIKSGKKSGGQPGHKGSTLNQSEKPEITVQCVPSTVCPECGKAIDTGQANVVETRQIWDLPAPVVPVITEYQCMESVCTCGCHCRGEFPKQATAPVSYGPNIHAAVSYLSTFQNIPFKRLSDAMYHLFGVGMSQGTVSNILNRMKKASAKSYDEIQKEVQSSKVAGADETGVKINGKGEWMWTFQTDLATYLFADEKRGREAIDKHFPNGLPNTTLVTDRHASYFTMNVENHQVCLAHLLRNLIFMTQLVPESDWFVRMLQLLRKAIHTKKEVGGALSEEMRRRLEEELDALFDDSPHVEDQSKQKEMNSFINGLKNKKNYMLVFLTRDDIPADNNGSERSVRPVKTKMKVSGQFKTFEGAQAYANLHSVVQTARKKGNNPFEALVQIANSIV